MFTNASSLQIIWMMIWWSALCSALPLAIGFGVFWIIRTTKKNKKAEVQAQSLNEEVRCLGCGAVIDKNRQACQICGWTWK